MLVQLDRKKASRFSGKLFALVEDEALPATGHQWFGGRQPFHLVVNEIRNLSACRPQRVPMFGREVPDAGDRHEVAPNLFLASRIRGIIRVWPNQIPKQPRNPNALGISTACGRW